ncbi:tetratricopeptide repeat protein [Chitinimonas naiadis]
MTNRIASVFSAAGQYVSNTLSALTLTGNQAREGQDLPLKAGDLITQHSEEGWTTVKILAVDKLPDGSATAHCLTYTTTDEKPTPDALQQASVLLPHAPILASSFNEGWESIGSKTPTTDELVPLVEYFKHTDFPRYVSLTGQSAKDIVHEANEHFRRANKLREEDAKFKAAIVEYGKAIELFPLFYEAIDNRGLAQMQLGRYKEAIADFELSLKVNPHGMVAFLSKGECLMQLEQLAAAEAAFQEGLIHFPEERATFTKFLERVRALRKKNLAAASQTEATREAQQETSQPEAEQAEAMQAAEETQGAEATQTVEEGPAAAEAHWAEERPEA